MGALGAGETETEVVTWEGPSSLGPALLVLPTPRHGLAPQHTRTAPSDCAFRTGVFGELTLQGFLSLSLPPAP